MPYSDTECPRCKELVPYNEARCRCGQFIGSPNWRKAVSEVEALNIRYNEAVEDCRKRGVDSQLEALEQLAEKA